MPSPDEDAEASPLIQEPQEHIHTQDDQQRTYGLGWGKDALPNVGLAAAFLVLYAFADILKYISTVRLIELGICREHYLQNGPGSDDVDYHKNIPEILCKLPSIQQQLAHLRGYLGTLEAIVGLVFTLPYGLLIDHLGERLVAGINVVGYLLSCAWIIIVCYCWQLLPIRSVVLAPLFRVIGGGSPILSSIIYSIAAKSTPHASRSLCFFFFMAVQLITEIISITIAAELLDRELLFTPMLLNFPVGLLCLATLCIIRPGAAHPSTRQTQGSAYEPDRLAEGEPAAKILEATTDSLRKSSHILSELLHDWNVIALLVTVPVAKLVNPITELMLQYIPKKFDLPLASASRALSIQAAESLIVLAAILPILKNVSQGKFHAVPAKVDLFIARYGFIAMSLGCLIMALSQALGGFVLGLLVFTLGCGARPALQSLLTDLARREHISILYAVIAVCDGIGSASGAFILNQSFAMALGWDSQLYLGFPFIIGIACYVFGFIASMSVGLTGTTGMIPQT